MYANLDDNSNDSDAEEEARAYKGRGEEFQGMQHARRNSVVDQWEERQLEREGEQARNFRHRTTFASGSGSGSSNKEKGCMDLRRSKTMRQETIDPYTIRQSGHDQPSVKDIDTPSANSVKGMMAVDQVAQEHFWNDVNYVVQILEPLYRCLRLLDGDKKPTMPYVQQAFEIMREKISEVSRCGWVLDIIDKRWTTITACATHSW
ncbi:hypothetical protein IFM89_021947 [Coptis chinensis]|uniref:Uncharacterized protein n=1 Tax=Coptis chinensis TaxID=261450 RepID=A0A835LMD8_9MAGN|nr:hypothetical protein IFM89_021947 [Coptis chinensis]